MNDTPQNTNLRDCDDVNFSLLNGAGHLSLSATARQPAAADAAEPAATDTDVEAWSIDAAGRYETCAARLNGLIDWVDGGRKSTGR